MARILLVGDAQPAILLAYLAGFADLDLLAFCRGVSLLRRGDLARRWRRTSCRTVPCCRPPGTARRAASRLPHGLQTYFRFDKLHRHLLAQPAALRVLLAAADVLVHAVHALDERLARRAIDLDHAALLPRCRDHFDDHRTNNIFVIVSRQSLVESASITMMHYTTSLARLTIFMNFRSRSSRATAPKMRVPRGLLSLSISTTALMSNRT